MTYQWQWNVLFQDPYLGWFINGIRWTLAISLVAYGLALVLGVSVGIARTLDSHVCRTVAQIYVTLFRSVPLLVQLFLWYFVVPELLPDKLGHWLKRDLENPEYWTAAIGLGLFMSARIAEQVRAAIGACSGGLANAAQSQGMSTAQVYRYVLLPVSFRYALPTLTSELLNTIKNSSLAMTIGMLELTGQSRQVEAYTFKGIESFTAATLIYILMSLLVILLGRQLEQYLEIPGMLRRGGSR
jgi:glutamate/aspartate transport system permease protein